MCLTSYGDKIQFVSKGVRLEGSKRKILLFPFLKV